jgi:hypothetical protein
VKCRLRAAGMPTAPAADAGVYAEECWQGGDT